MNVAEFIKEFPNAILINKDNKSVWITKDKKLKVYSEQYYNDFINSIDITKIRVE